MDSPEPPNYSKQMNQQNELSQQQFDFYKQTYENDIKPRQQRYDALVADTVKRQNEVSDFGMRTAREDRSRYMNVNMPTEASMAAEALGLDPDAAARGAMDYAAKLDAWEKGGSKGDMPTYQLPGSSDIAGARKRMFDTAAGQATADVEQAFANAEGGLARNMGRYGINPNSGAAAASANQIALAKATGIAGATTAARRYADQTSWAKRADVANLGRGIATSNTAQAALGLSGASAAGATGAQGVQSGLSSAGFMNHGYQQAQAANMNAANLMNMGYQNAATSQQLENQQLAGYGQMIGTGLSYYGSGAGKR